MATVIPNIQGTEFQPAEILPAVVLVHGLWNTGRIFQQLQLYLENQGRTVHVVDLVPNNGDIGIEQQAAQLQAFIVETIGTQARFDLLGFSMGGLVSRYYVQRLGGQQQVRRLVGVAVPHHGSLLAWFRWNLGGRQMRPGSQFLADLNQDMATLSSCYPVWLWTSFDLLVLPAHNCCLSVGDSLCLPVKSHTRMVWDPVSIAAIATLLNRPLPPQNSNPNPESKP